MSYIGRENSASACKFQKQRMSVGGGSELLRDWSKNKKKVEVWVEKGVWRKGGGCPSVGGERGVGVTLLWVEKRGVWEPDVENGSEMLQMETSEERFLKMDKITVKVSTCSNFGKLKSF